MDRYGAFIVTLYIFIVLFFISAIATGIYESLGFIGIIVATLGVFAFGFVWMYIYKKWGDKN